MKYLTFISLIVFVISCQDLADSNNDLSLPEAELTLQLDQEITQESSEIFHVLNTSHYSNQWIDLTWEPFAGAVSYKIIGRQQSGDDRVITKFTSETTARAFPTSDPSGEFDEFELGFGFADFQIIALDSNDQEIGQSNIVSYGVKMDTQCVFCGLNVGLCNIRIDVSLPQAGGECEE